DPRRRHALGGRRPLGAPVVELDLARDVRVPEQTAQQHRDARARRRPWIGKCRVAGHDRRREKRLGTRARDQLGEHVEQVLAGVGVRLLRLGHLERLTTETPSAQRTDGERWSRLSVGSVPLWWILTPRRRRDPPGPSRPGARGSPTRAWTRRAPAW